MQSSKTVVLASGGLDSATLAHQLRAEGHVLLLLSFNYGQRHLRELEFAEQLAAKLNSRWHCIDLAAAGLPALFKGSSLTDPDVAVPDGHYEDDSMKLTIVPNRNAVMLAMAFAWAGIKPSCWRRIRTRHGSESSTAVAYAAHGGDHFIYPDCRPAFIESFEAMERLSLDDPNIALLAPFQHMRKAEIVAAGDKLGVAFENTWSCYKGGALHCGTCGTCVERREAFALANVDDPTRYALANV